ncbi:MAG: hypothetical protein Q4C55_01310 [Eubacterium sp.]|nr:hypothetical protein [Eubacterium sp.]
MQLGMTIPLQKFLRRPAPPYGAPEELGFSWEIHRIIFGGLDTLVAVNAASRFCVAARGMTASDWLELTKTTADLIACGLREESIPYDKLGAYLKQAGEPVITKTHGRKPVAGLNRAVEALVNLDIPLVDDEKFQALHCHFANREVCKCAGYDKKGRPVDFMRELLEQF